MLKPKGLKEFGTRYYRRVDGIVEKYKKVRVNDPDGTSHIEWVVTGSWPEEEFRQKIIFDGITNKNKASILKLKEVKTDG